MWGLPTRSARPKEVGPLRIPTSWVGTLGVLLFIYGLFTGVTAGDWYYAVTGLWLVGLAAAWIAFWWAVGGGLGAWLSDVRMRRTLERLLAAEAPAYRWRVRWESGRGRLSRYVLRLVAEGVAEVATSAVDEAGISQRAHQILAGVIDASAPISGISVRVRSSDGGWTVFDEHAPDNTTSTAVTIDTVRSIPPVPATPLSPVSLEERAEDFFAQD